MLYFFRKKYQQNTHTKKLSFQVKAYEFIKFMYMYVNGFYVYIHKLLGNITKAYYSIKQGCIKYVII
jgi:hypothetical protein